MRDLEDLEGLEGLVGILCRRLPSDESVILKFFKASTIEGSARRDLTSICCLNRCLIKWRLDSFTSDSRIPRVRKKIQRLVAKAVMKARLKSIIKPWMEPMRPH